MIQVPCPHCGPRNVSEFRYSGEGGARPDPATVSPEDWRGYLYLHRNPRGWTKENWYHGSGCRKFFSIERHTHSNEIRAVGAAEESAAADTGDRA